MSTPTCISCGQKHERDHQGVRVITCRAHKRGSGGEEPCHQQPLAGQDLCRFHGGKSPALLARAEQNLEEKRVLATLKKGKVGELLEEMSIESQHPIEGLLEAVRQSGAMMRMMSHLVGELDIGFDVEMVLTPWGDDYIVDSKSLYGPNSKGDGAPHVLVNLYGVWLERHAKVCKLALDAGIAERQLRIEESKAAQLAMAIRGVLTDLNLSAEQQARAPELVRKHLIALTAASQAENLI